MGFNAGMEDKLATGMGFLIIELMRKSEAETPKDLAARAGVCLTI